MKRPDKNDYGWVEGQPPDEYYDDLLEWINKTVLPVLREMREWVGDLHTGIAGVAVMAVYESGRLDALIKELEEEK